LGWLRRQAAADASRLRNSIEARLRHEPTRRDTNRKPTAEGAAAAWELRVQPYRVYYEVDEDAGEVTVAAIWRKPRETGTPVPQE
jgi:mRNA-degrading endonuclease RelE of RelBE toxin-antitoxin system